MNAVVAGLCIVLCVLAAVRAWTTRDAQVRRIVLEMTAVIALTPLLDIAAGALLQAREPGLERLAGLYILIPPFVSQAGALGGILSSRLSSKLQLGVITPSGLPERPAVLDASIVVALGRGRSSRSSAWPGSGWPICSAWRTPPPGRWWAARCSPACW